MFKVLIKSIAYSNNIINIKIDLRKILQKVSHLLLNICNKVAISYSSNIKCFLFLI